MPIDGNPNSEQFGAVPVVYLFNETTYDRQRGATGLAVPNFGPLARTVTTTSATLTNYNGRGIIVYLNVTANASAAGVTLKLLGIDPVSAATYVIAATSAITTTGLFVLRVYPGITAVSGTSVAVNDVVPRSFGVSVVAGDASSVTYSAGYGLLV